MRYKIRVIDLSIEKYCLKISSVLLSKALVDSSKINILGLLYNALAIPILLFLSYRNIQTSFTYHCRPCWVGTTISSSSANLTFISKF